MFNDFFSFNPSITEAGSYYLIQGIVFKDLEIDLKNTFGTSVIANRLLIRLSGNRFKIHRFFMVEFAYLLDNIINTQGASRQRYYRVNLNKYRFLYEEVKTKTWINTTLKDYDNVYDINKALKGFKFKPFSGQLAFLESYAGVKYGFQLKGILLDSAAGTGKASHLDSNVLTPNGFVKMRDIKPGDFVIGQNGKPTKVLAIHPQGKKQLYTVLFKDGRKEEVCKEHLWEIRRCSKSEVSDTITIIQYLEQGDSVYIPLMENGYDGPVYDTGNLEEVYYDGIHLIDTLPDKYLHGSIKVRETLLKGIMYRTGGLSDNGHGVYSTESLKFAEQVQYLIRSLGGVAKLSEGLENDYNVTFNLYQSFLEMVSITPSRVDYSQCITVDAPDHLYIASDFIVTHNTVTSLMWSRMLPGKKTIILVLKHLINEPWLDHIKPDGRRYCFTSPPKVWVSTSDDDPRKSDAEYFIFYKEQLRKDDWKGISFTSIISALSGNGTVPLKMIIDEAHNYNDISSQQTQGAIAIGSHPYITDVLSMSGTPIKSAGKEMYPLFCMIDKFFDKNIRPNFLKLYSRNNEALNELLAHRLGRIKFTINAIDGLGDPPVPVPLSISFPGVEKYTLTNIRAELIYYIQERAKFYQKVMPNYLFDYKGYVDAYQDSIEDDPTALSELAVYRKTVEYFRKNGFNTFTDTDKSKFCKQVEEKIEARLKGEDLKYFRHIVPAIKYLSLKIKGEALGNVLGKARINAIVDLINHVDLAGVVKSGIKKTAIYSTYIEAINTAVDKLRADGCHPVKYHSQDKITITEVISKLREPKTDSIVTSYDSLSEGQPLLECNQLVLLNLPWRDYILKQTIARIFRKGQDTECFVWSLTMDTGGEENITTRTQDIVEYFRQITDQILNGGLGFDHIEGLSLKLVDDTKYDFASLVPFDIPVINFRPKFLERTFTSIFR